MMMHTPARWWQMCVAAQRHWKSAAEVLAGSRGGGGPPGSEEVPLCRES